MCLGILRSVVYIKVQARTSFVKSIKKTNYTIEHTIFLTPLKAYQNLRSWMESIGKKETYPALWKLLPKTCRNSVISVCIRAGYLNVFRILSTINFVLFTLMWIYFNQPETVSNSFIRA